MRTQHHDNSKDNSGSLDVNTNTSDINNGHGGRHIPGRGGFPCNIY